MWVTGLFNPIRSARSIRGALGWTYTPTSSLVNIAHFGFLRDFSQSNPIGLTLGQSDAPKYGLTGIPITPETAGLPPIYIFGLTTKGLRSIGRSSR
jgi:hypothetical protein